MPSDKNDIRNQAYVIIEKANRLIGKLPCREHWNDTILDAATVQTLEHHADHIEKMRIRQQEVEPYKLLSWYGFMLARINTAAPASVRFAPLRAFVNLMNQYLAKSYASYPGMDGIGMDKGCLREICRLAENDGVDDEFAIGKNGLYCAFKCAQNTKAKVRQRIVDGALSA